MSSDLVKSYRARIAALEAEEAEFRAKLASVVLPQPLPPLTKADSVRTGPVGTTAKEYRAKADNVRAADPDLAEGYRQLAAEAEQREMARPRSRPVPASPLTWTPPDHLAGVIDALGYRPINRRG